MIQSAIVIQLVQLLGVEQGLRARALRDEMDLHHRLAKPDTLKGITREYRPRDDDGEVFPSERQMVQVRVEDAVRSIQGSLTALWDLVATKDEANASAGATADVILDDGTVVLQGVRAVTLLFLGKQLVNLHTLVEKLPTLQPGPEWGWDPATRSWVTPPTETTRTKKIPRNHQLAPATDQHAAQVQVYMEDEIVGYWTTRQYSGALPASRVRQLILRIEDLQRAVKRALARANQATAQDVHIGGAVLEYIFAP